MSEYPKYAWWCPVCDEVRFSETCPKCPDVLLLRCVKYDEDDYIWRNLV